MALTGCRDLSNCAEVIDLFEKADAAIAPIAEARAMGLQGTVLATLELSLLVTRTVAERELKHLGVVVGGTVASILGRTPCIDLTGVGTITAIA